VYATYHLRSAASGKAGALITAFAFGSVVEAIGLDGTLGLLSGIMVLCGLLTFLIPETNGKTLAEIEDDAMYGVAPEVSIAALSPSVSSMTKTGYAGLKELVV
jgi:MFS transporter, PHS family, inorganic phosphate transporter